MEQAKQESNTQAYMPMPQDSTFMQFRLDTSNLINQIRVTLSGKIVTYSREPNGEIVEKETKVSEPLVNDQGFALIVNYVQTVVNPQVVQGYLKEEEFYNFMADFREDLSFTIFVNMADWGISEGAYKYIIDTICNTVKLFITRLIDNKERESYHMFKQIETNRLNTGKMKI